MIGFADALEAALDEQVRREANHTVEYRLDQRIRAIQQRLSRRFGERAFSAEVRAKILARLEAKP